ncbi:MAG: 3-methyladenine DNA glycosylase, partial [Verrucomicrobiaceae bacterium]
GPGKLTKAMGIDGTAHGTSFLTAAHRGILRGEPSPTVAGGRIGITRAVYLPWRFGDPASRSLSRKF